MSDDLPPLNLDGERFADLDGLLLLLTLCREAQDAAHLDRAERLQSALHRAASSFAERHGYRDEVLDTWKLLLGARMVAWHPHLEPTETELKHAETDLAEEQHLFLDPRIPVKPRHCKTGTRSERRWRRRVWVRACCLHLERGWRNPAFEYRDACPAYEWLIAQREQIRQHKAAAMDRLMLGDEKAWLDDLPPLTMPAALHARRRRPSMTDEEEWVFADTSLYDVIPVVPIPPSSPDR
ncbi:MAG: hypothetical protein ACREPL_14420 [Rhodanobacteraceae bacterium]